jgi:hypothetical protein
VKQSFFVAGETYPDVRLKVSWTVASEGTGERKVKNFDQIEIHYVGKKKGSDDIFDEDDLKFTVEGG